MASTLILFASGLAIARAHSTKSFRRDNAVIELPGLFRDTREATLV